MMAYGAKSLQAIQANRQPLLTALAALAITEVIIRYQGDGDSGDITEICVLPESVATHIQEALLTQSVSYHSLIGEYREGAYHYSLSVDALNLDSALRDFTLTWLDAHHSGWENNEGGAGFVTINVTESSFRLDHLVYYTDSTSYEHRL